MVFVSQTRILEFILKTITDYILSFAGLILLLPFIVVYALFIILFCGENPFYLQKRTLGDKTKPLTIFKLRTIKRSGEVKQLTDNSFHKNLSNDFYLPIGKFLRTSGLDETPQLVLVLMGKMSLIGPRPLMQSDIELINKQYPMLISRRNELKSKPGISGMWQLYRKPELSFDELIEYDFYYEENKNLLLDIKLMIKTITKIITHSHADTLS